MNQRGYTAEEQANADRIPFAAAFERSHGHEDNPNVGLADEVAEQVASALRFPLPGSNVSAEHKGGGRLQVTRWGTDEDSGDSIVTFQAVRP